MKRILVILNLLFFTNALTFAQANKASAIIDAMQKKYKTMSSFSAAFAYSIDGGGASYTGNITVKGQKFRLKTAGQEIFNNGKEVSTYIKETNEVNISDYEPSENDLNPAKVYSFDKKGYRYVFVEEVNEAGQVYEVIELSPEKKGTQVAKVKIKLNKKDKSVKSWVITDKNGKRQTFKVNKFTPNVPVDDKFFVFDKSKYPGVEVNDLR
ncbi:Outer membrane lipoprotein-sorting protein [Pseudarcicella hirudinis]|uniref:Outer membrane lipoprotein-sorting protein n=1 Tax=Pseudarcicella hirudinis TaxID=1079859 RepID=A0A1I5P366_9BACT|nr:outer membrane lipoprotein carrier protein LolA [Pseudarcicella hirudinis]SFP28495.1 Outer membrane lipoprotein-sorting protein [Pseudarcicella hirudinis]